MWVTGSLGNSAKLADRLREIAYAMDTDWEPEDGNQLDAWRHKAYRLEEASDAQTTKAIEAAEVYTRLQVEYAEAERAREYTVQVVRLGEHLALVITSDGEREVNADTGWDVFDAGKADAMLAEQGYARTEEWAVKRRRGRCGR